MLKIGDKVETPIGVGVVKVECEQDNYVVEIRDYTALFNVSVLKPYTSAHDKLIALGYKHSNTSHGIEYSKNKMQILIDVEEKTYKVYWLVDDYAYEIDLELSRILTQYLEEMEE